MAFAVLSAARRRSRRRDLTAQERALRQGRARASDRFDLVVAAPGSQTDLLLKVAFLRGRDRWN